VWNVPNSTSAPTSGSTINVAQFLTIQATQGASWTPTPLAAGGVKTPNYMNTAALRYPGFSTLSGLSPINGISYDLLVMLQTGDYAQCSLIFMAVPSGTASAIKQ
jgi:hypothetical protein